MTTASPTTKILSRADCIAILATEDATFARFEQGTFDREDPRDTDFSLPVVAAALERLRAECPIADGVVADMDFAYDLQEAAEEEYIRDRIWRAEGY